MKSTIRRRAPIERRSAHPSAAWTLQQLREAVGFEERYEYLLHDRDSILAKHLDESIGRLGVKVLKSPPCSPMANAICERVIGTIRRECLDWMIPLSESHLRFALNFWIAHYNGGRPHMSLGPGIPNSPAGRRAVLDEPPAAARDRGRRAGTPSRRSTRGVAQPPVAANFSSVPILRVRSAISRYSRQRLMSPFSSSS
jgi:hypothetical protein